MVKLNFSIKAFSLIDVIVAMIIVMLSFVITVHLFTKVQHSTTSEIHAHALLKMDEIKHTIELENLKQSEFQETSYKIVCENNPYQAHPELRHIKLVALKPTGDTLAYQQFLKFPADE